MGVPILANPTPVMRRVTPTGQEPKTQERGDVFRLLFLLAFITVLTALEVFAGRVLTFFVDTTVQSAWLTKYRYAHRGLHDAHTPENSLGAFQRAVQRGYAVEMDVQLTKDGQVMIFHDRDLGRMTGVRGKVRHFTLSELKSLRLGGTEEQIPTLEEVLALIDGRVPILFETKGLGISGRLERRFFQKVEHYAGNYAIQSFSPLSLRWFMRHAPHIVRGQLACDIRRCDRELAAWKRLVLDGLLYQIRRLRTNFLCRPNFISCELHRVSGALLKKLRVTGAPVLGWTIRSEEQYFQVRQHIDAVIFEGFVPDAPHDRWFAAAPWCETPESTIRRQRKRAS